MVAAMVTSNSPLSSDSEGSGRAADTTAIEGTGTGVIVEANGPTMTSSSADSIVLDAESHTTSECPAERGMNRIEQYGISQGIKRIKKPQVETVTDDLVDLQQVNDPQDIEPNNKSSSAKANDSKGGVDKSDKASFGDDMPIRLTRLVVQVATRAMSSLAMVTMHSSPSLSVLLSCIHSLIMESCT